MIQLPLFFFFFSKSNAHIHSLNNEFNRNYSGLNIDNLFFPFFLLRKRNSSKALYQKLYEQFLKLIYVHSKKKKKKLRVGNYLVTRDLNLDISIKKTHVRLSRAFSFRFQFI